MNLFLLLLAVVAMVILWFALRPAPARRKPPRTAAVLPAAARPPAEPARAAAADDGLPAAIAAILERGVAELESAALPDLLQDFTLLSIDDLDEQQRDELNASLAGIPLPPRSTQALLSPEYLANAATREFTELVTREPLLAAKVIGRVNSPFYGLASPIVSVSHAVTYLGMNAVRNMALQFTLEQAFASEDPELQAFHARLFDAGTVAAELCTLLSPKLGYQDVGATSTQTVLSFLGDFAMPALLPGRSAMDHWPLGLLERTCNEQFTRGCNATIVGGLLMAGWGLPASVSDEVRDMSRILVTPAAQVEPARGARLAFCYFCARLAEAIVLGRVLDPAHIDIAGAGQAEYFHFRSYLNLPPLDRLADQLKAPGTQRAIARLISAAARLRETPLTTAYGSRSAAGMRGDGHPVPGLAAGARESRRS